MYFPPTLKPDYEPDSAKIASAIKVFCFEGHSASRCFYKSPLGGPCEHFWGGKSWADTALPRPAVAFETETRPETFEIETKTGKNGSRDGDQVSRLHHYSGVTRRLSQRGQNIAEEGPLVTAGGH